MKIGISGNCQAEAMGLWLRQSIPNLDLIELPAYHLLEHEDQVSLWINKCRNASRVYAMPVATNYRGIRNLGTDILRDHFGDRLRLYPNLHCEAFFPFYGYAKTADGATITNKSFPGNPHGDYHDFLAVACLASRQPWGRAMRWRIKAASLWPGIVIANAKHSIDELYRRLRKMRSTLADEEIPISNLCGYTLNHPRAALLNQLYLSTWTKDLGRPRCTFMPLEFEPFKKLGELPIHDFVKQAIENNFGRLASDLVSSRELGLGWRQYEHNFKVSMNYYRRHSWIVEANRKHKKFLLAQKFLRFGLGL